LTILAVSAIHKSSNLAEVAVDSIAKIN